MRKHVRQRVGAHACAPLGRPISPTVTSAGGCRMTVDFHCHIDLYPDPVALVEQVQSRGVATLSVTTTPKAFTRTAALAETAPMIATALGLHPELAGLRHREVELFEELLPSARFVGEIGLDGSVRFTQTRALQERVFGTILSACARAGGRVMSIHSQQLRRRFWTRSPLNRMPGSRCCIGSPARRLRRAAPSRWAAGSA